MQVLDAEACEAMRRTFEEEARQPNFPGLLVDFDHFSHDPAQPTTAAGWIGALEDREEGLYAQVRWSDLGHQALTGGRYRLVSPVWNRADCDAWTAPAGAEGREVVHLRPRRLDRVALTNDPNLPGLAPICNRAEEKSETKQEELFMKSLRTDLIRHLRMGAGATDEELTEALRREGAELEALRNRCGRLQEAQADADLERFAEVITNRDVVRSQLLANRDGTLALLQALRRPTAPMPLHQPRLSRPNLHLLSPVAAVNEPDPALARRVANRARQLQSQLKIGHHAAFSPGGGRGSRPGSGLV